MCVDKGGVVKPRDGEVRGSNGRDYDVVHGIVVNNGGRTQDVYFDGSTEVLGRSSAMAAKDAAASPPATSQ